MSIFGSFNEIGRLLVMKNQLAAARLVDDLVWVLPPETLPGVTMAYGIPVIRADVPEPLLAHTGRSTYPSEVEH